MDNFLIHFSHLYKVLWKFKQIHSHSSHIHILQLFTFSPFLKNRLRLSGMFKVPHTMSHFLLALILPWTHIRRNCCCTGKLDNQKYLMRTKRMTVYLDKNTYQRMQAECKGGLTEGKDFLCNGSHKKWSHVEKEQYKGFSVRPANSQQHAVMHSLQTGKEFKTKTNTFRTCSIYNKKHFFLSILKCLQIKRVKKKRKLYK